jgi:hypothetical protein
MSNRILSYRGLLADGGQDTILLSTKKGEVGYRIIKFQVIPNNPAAQEPEAIVQVWKVEQTLPTTELIDFSDQTLLAAAYYSGGGTTTKPQDVVIIFDKEIFNQDIYVTLKDDNDNESMNYYIELEQMPLSEAHAMVATLKDIRNNS